MNARKISIDEAIAKMKEYAETTAVSLKDFSDGLLGFQKIKPSGIDISTLLKANKYNVLHLLIEKKWFDMIASGEKKEEYRALSRYWAKRITKIHNFEYVEGMENLFREDKNNVFFKKYDYVHFFNGGYFSTNLPNMLVSLEKISIGLPNPEWTDKPNEKCFIMGLGEIIKV